MVAIIPYHKNIVKLKRKAMKTKNESGKWAAVRLLLIVPVIVIALLANYSCGNTATGENTVTTIAPPPPPPPPIAPDADSVYQKVDELPVFAGGETALLNWVVKNTTYPDAPKKNNITGKVVVKFVIGKDGSVSNVAIAESVNPDLDAEAVRVISSLPKFEKPAIVNGKPVAVHFMMPISFKLN